MKLLPKLIGTFLIIIALVIASRELSDRQKVFNNSSLLEKLWEKDLKKLKIKNQLPKEWKEIGELQYRSMSDLSAQWLNSLKVPVNIKHNGSYRLDVSLDHIQDNKEVRAIIHYNLVHLKTGNTVWEFGRTFKLKYNGVEKQTEVIPVNKANKSISKNEDSI